MHRNEHREEPSGLADLLLPFAMIDDGILLQQDGSLLAGWTYRGPDMMSASAAENGCAQRQAEFGDAAGQRLDGPMRCHTFPRTGLSGTGRLSRCGQG